MRWLVAGIVLMLALAQPALAQTLTSASFGVLKYFPGDVVHIVVDAPPDVIRVTALMPDGEQLNMSFSRRAGVWHNYWEVPPGFKKGGYTAKLRAVDVEGRVFEGDSELFYVGEPTLPMIMQIMPTKEARALRPPAVKKEAAKKKKIAQKPKPKPKKVKKAAVKPKPQPVDRIRLIVEARENLFREEYGKLKGKLDTLLRIDPDNNEIRSMRKRIAK